MPANDSPYTISPFETTKVQDVIDPYQSFARQNAAESASKTTMGIAQMLSEKQDTAARLQAIASQNRAERGARAREQMSRQAHERGLESQRMQHDKEMEELRDKLARAREEEARSWETTRADMDYVTDYMGRELGEGFGPGYWQMPIDLFRNEVDAARGHYVETQTMAMMMNMMDPTFQRRIIGGLTGSPQAMQAFGGTPQPPGGGGAPQMPWPGGPPPAGTTPPAGGLAGGPMGGPPGGPAGGPPGGMAPPPMLERPPEQAVETSQTSTWRTTPDFVNDFLSKSEVIPAQQKFARSYREASERGAAYYDMAQLQQFDHIADPNRALWEGAPYMTEGLKGVINNISKLAANNDGAILTDTLRRLQSVFGGTTAPTNPNDSRIPYLPHAEAGIRYLSNLHEQIATTLFVLDRTGAADTQERKIRMPPEDRAALERTGGEIQRILTNYGNTIGRSFQGMRAAAEDNRKYGEALSNPETMLEILRDSQQNYYRLRDAWNNFDKVGYVTAAKAAMVDSRSKMFNVTMQARQQIRQGVPMADVMDWMNQQVSEINRQSTQTLRDLTPTYGRK